MSTEVMAPKRNKRSEASKAIAKAIIDQYQPSNAEEMQDAVRGKMILPSDVKSA